MDLARTYGARGLARRAVHEALLRSRAYAWLEQRAIGHAPAPRLLPIDRSAVAEVMSRHPAAAAAAVARAEGVLGGHYPYFTDLTIEVGWPPAWHRHARTGVEWPAGRHWSAYAHTQASDGDIKWIWEPARFHFAWLFSRAYVVTGDRRFADETWRGFRDWSEHNPYGRGAAWYCAQELSFRCFAILFAASVFSGAGVAPDPELRSASQLLFAAAHRIDLTLEHSLSQRNNHALTESVALWTLSHVFRDSPRAGRWRRRAERAMRECVLDQFAADGAYIQESLNYHRLALDTLLWARFVARSFEVALPDVVGGALSRSFELLRGLVPCDGGAVPNYGHNDGARLLALSSSSQRDVRPTLQHLARELRAPLPFSPGPWDEQGSWLGLAVSAGGPSPPRTEGLRVTSSGYLSSHHGPWMVFSRTPSHVHHRPAHADALHVDVWHFARNVALDPGTFAYSEPAPWDNALVETRVHNTCSVGDRSQMRRRGKFLWTHWASARLHAHGERDGVAAWLADVHCDWDGHFVHTRLVRHSADQLDVLDLVEGRRPDVLRLHWNLDGDAWRRAGTRWTDRGLVVTIDSTSEASFRDVRADPRGPLGWSSPTYGAKDPCTAIEVETTGTRAWFHTTFTREGRPLERLPDEVIAAWVDGQPSYAMSLLSRHE